MVTQSEMEQVLLRAKATGGDFAELFFEDRNDTILKDINSQISGVTSLHIYGVGLYILKGTTSVYVYSNNTSFQSLMHLAEVAAGLLPFAATQKAGGHITFSLQKNPVPNPIKIHPGTVSAGKKAAIVKEIELAAKNAGPIVRSMNVEYYDNVQNVTIVNSDGLYTEDTRAFTRVRLVGTVEWQNKACFEFNDFIKPKGFEIFSDHDYIGFAETSVKKMEDSLKAKTVKPCVVPVVFDAGPCGEFWHEACGHNLEATSAKTGCFAGMDGQKIASEKVTLVDDGYVPGLCGTEAIDDEGHPTQKNILIKDGILIARLCDRKGGRELGCGSTGSGRRQSYTFAPVARMHNTYLAAGEDDDDEMISSIDNGLFVTELGGGSSGSNFAVAVKAGYWIRDGKLAEPVGGMSLNGNSLDVIKRVDAVGKNLQPDLGGGFCGAASGLVQTTTYEPKFRVSFMRVGGV